MISIKLQSNFIEITLWLGCFPVNWLHIFRIRFLKNTSGGQLLKKYCYEHPGFLKTHIQVNLCVVFTEYQKQSPGMFSKKSVLKNFGKFTRKQLCQSLFFSKVAYNFIRKETLTQAFSYRFCGIFKKRFFIEHSWKRVLEKFVKWSFP